MAIRSSPVAMLSLTLLLIAACSGGGLLGPTTPGSVSVESVEFASFSLVNSERQTTRSGDQLARESLVARIAREYSEAMRDQGFFSHLAPDGSGLESRLREAGVEFRAAGENLARVTNAADPAAYAHTLLMQHEDHRQNILNSEYKLLGIGAARDQDTVWITQIFIEK